jgi:hypothetical protein
MKITCLYKDTIITVLKMKIFYVKFGTHIADKGPIFRMNKKSLEFFKSKPI